MLLRSLYFGVFFLINPNKYLAGRGIFITAFDEALLILYLADHILDTCM